MPQRHIRRERESERKRQRETCFIHCQCVNQRVCHSTRDAREDVCKLSRHDDRHDTTTHFLLLKCDTVNMYPVPEHGTIIEKETEGGRSL